MPPGSKGENQSAEEIDAAVKVMRIAKGGKSNAAVVVERRAK